MLTVVHRNGEHLEIEEGVDAYVGHGLPNMPARGELRVQDAKRTVIAAFKPDEWLHWFKV
jgi:hypothetical protein